MRNFNVTFERWTEDDTEAGEPGDVGFLAKGVSLREAVETVKRAPMADVSWFRISDSLPRGARWVTVYGMESFKTGNMVDYSIHFPENTTPSSRRRLCELLG